MKRDMILKQLSDCIEQNGYTCMMEFNGGVMNKTFYSIGLWHTFSHPEIVITGMQTNYCQEILYNMVHDIKKGAVVEPNTINYDIIVDTDTDKPFRTAFIHTTDSYREKELSFANMFYFEREYQAVQFIWPDKEGVLPVEPGYNVTFKQPLFNNDFFNIKLKEPI